MRSGPLTASWRRAPTPDAGGSREQFDLINRAYVILSGQLRRDRYDRTGSLDDAPRDSITDSAREIIAQMLTTILLGEPEPARADILQAMREHLKRSRLANRRSSRIAKRAIARARDLRKRLTLREGPDHMAAVLAREESALSMALAATEAKGLAMDRALEILSEYEFRPDLGPDN